MLLSDSSSWERNMSKENPRSQYHMNQKHVWEGRNSQIPAILGIKKVKNTTYSYTKGPGKIPCNKIVFNSFSVYLIMHIV